MSTLHDALSRRAPGRALAALMLACFCQAAMAGGDSRLYIDAHIDGKPAKLIFDTGTTGTSIILFDEAVRRLGLKLVPDADVALFNGEPLGKTEQYPLSMLGKDYSVDFGVLHRPPYVSPDGDGVIPYWSLANGTWAFDISRGIFHIIMTPPEELKGFIHAWILRDETKILMLEIPNSQGAPVTVAIDTGQDTGISLSHEQWQAWLAEHPDSPTTMSAYYMPSLGVQAGPEAWADEFKIGDLVMRNVPVKEANSLESNSGEYCLLGLYAVARLAMVLDGVSGTAYVTPSSNTPPVYAHNRLGAVFVPQSEHSDDLVAVVAKGSPAETAGIANGDVLLQIDKSDVAQWRTKTELQPLSSRLQDPAGAKHTLVVRRGAQVLKFKVALKDIWRQACKGVRTFPVHGPWAGPPRNKSTCIAVSANIEYCLHVLIKYELYSLAVQSIRTGDCNNVYTQGIF